MTWPADGLFVKVCGLGSPADIDAAAEAGADAVGFVWYPPSPRHLELPDIAALAARAPMTTVLVTAGAESADLVAAAARTGVDAVQPHGANARVAMAAAHRLGVKVIHPIAAGEDIPAAVDDELLLVDTPDVELPGGTGKAFDWDLARGIEQPFLLAGGLGPENVVDAVRRVRPFGVDASSGLESSPGVKSADLIRSFVEKAKNA